MAFSWPHVFKDGVKMIISGSQVMENFEAVREIAEGLPVGSMLDYAGTGDPSSTFVVADGRELSRTTYATLYALIKTTYGAGNGTTTFNLPNTLGRVLVGAGTGSGLAAKAVGGKAGQEAVTLSAAQSGMPEHGHNMSSEQAGGLEPNTENGGDGYAKILGATAGGGANRALANNYAGSFSFRIGVAPAAGKAASASHPTMMPYLAVSKIIRIK
jgi:microcystin-dependent protein